MKWRLMILSAMVLMLFGFAGLWYFRAFVRPRAHGVIVFVANGLDLELISKARQQAESRGKKLFIDQLPSLGILSVRGLDQEIPDESSAVTALACGVRTKNGFLGYAPNGEPLTSLIYRAQYNNRFTGLVTTGDIASTTPVVFYDQRKGELPDEKKHADTLIDSEIKVVFGGGARHFKPANVINEHGRLDSKDLQEEAKSRGFSIVTNSQELEKIPAWRTAKCLGLFSNGWFNFTPLRQGVSQQPPLEQMVRKSIEILQPHLSGYLLVVDHGLIAQAARNNWTALAVDEVQVLDEAVKTAVTYAGKQSLVIVVSGYSYGAIDRTRSTSPQIGKTQMMAEEWLTGPGGAPQTVADKSWLKKQQSLGIMATEANNYLSPRPAIRFARQADVTSGPGWVGAYGFGAEKLRGFYPNTDFYNRLDELIR